MSSYMRHVSASPVKTGVCEVMLIFRCANALPSTWEDIKNNGEGKTTARPYQLHQQSSLAILGSHRERMQLVASQILIAARWRTTDGSHLRLKA